MAIFLTLGLIHLINSPSASPLALIPLFLQADGTAEVALGLWRRRLIVFANQTGLRLEYEGLYPVS